MDPSSPAIPLVIRAHMDAVRNGDPAAMAAHYGVDAVIERPDLHIRCKLSISEYFGGVPGRLARSRVQLDSVDVHDALRVTFHWHLEGGAAHGVRGSDTVQDG